MPLSTEVHLAHLRVRYAETDAMGVAHHASYIPWLEMGRVEWLRAMGLSYAEWERAGYQLPVIELHIRYVSPARFDDALIVRTALWDVRSRTVRFSYEVVTDERHPRQLANAMTHHICLSGGQVVRLPDALREVSGIVRDDRPGDG
jgi:acyl-CoA thioester hydrolase